MAEVPIELELALGLGGEMGARVSVFDWARHPLGPMDEWPEWMRTTVAVALLSRFPIVLWFGRDFHLIYNDGYRPMLGAKHPRALGATGMDVWSEIWPTIGPMLHGVLETGVATWSDDQLLLLERAGYPEECYFTYTYSPIVNDTGSVGGIFCAVTETTGTVIGERRLQTLRELADDLNEATTVEDVARTAIHVLARNPHDLPFAAIYLPVDERHARLASAAGGGADELLPPMLSLADEGGDFLRGAAHERPRTLDRLGSRFPELIQTLGVEAPNRALALSIDGSGPPGCAGWLLAGVSRWHEFDDQYRSFYDLVVSQIATAMARADAYELEHRRAQELAELDRAKTLFFSNVSHEFRTPLTLLLGPLEEALADSEAPLVGQQRERLEIARRNAMRLLRLVNSLLDFSRVQAGRVDPVFEEVDLVALTNDFASVFRSAIGQAGLELQVRAEPGLGRVWVDEAMWEIIVLNLLSNAFKFTLEGEIRIDLRAEGDMVVVEVSDTGVGIAAEELPRVFDRFHRVSGTRGRSHEGSGIGLSLVRELVEAHDGTISVESEVGAGTRFAIRLAAVGRGEIVPARPRGEASVSRVGEQFAAEVLRWLPGAASTDSAASNGGDASGEHVLVVDDNSDMRAYLVRLLGRRYRVSSAADGAEAVVRMREERPDLVVADVMMPNVDGLELVSAIRAEPGLEDLPVVLLSARAGSEAAAGGLAHGADDYIVKPFTSEDLLGRIAARLATGRDRRQRQTLATLTASLSGAMSMQEIARAVYDCLETALRVGNVTLALVDEASPGSRVRFWHAAAYGGGVNERYHTGSLEGHTPVSVAVRDRVRVVLESREQVAERYPSVLSDFVEGGTHALAAVPIVGASDTVLGCLVVTWNESRPLTSEGIELCERTAAAVVEAVLRIRIREIEHGVIQQFQERLLEIDMHSPRAVVAARYRPAETSMTLGGDWYDVLTLDDGRLGLSVGDVVGKGLPAATVMSQLRSALGMAAVTESTPEDAVASVDAYAGRLPTALGTTLCYLVLDTGSVRWCCAGHPPPLVHNGASRYLTGGQRGPLGSAVSADATLDGESLGDGSLVLLYTDGLVERRGEVLDEGLGRLARAVDEHAYLPVGPLCDALLDAMSDGGFADDVALVAARVCGSTPELFVDAYPASARELGAARSRLREWLRRRPIDDDRLDDVLIAVGEASANAVEHGSNFDPRQVIGVQVTVHDGSLFACVSDGGRWTDDSTRGPQGGRGRGFSIMKALMDEVTVRRERLGTSVLLRTSLGKR